MSSLPDVLSVEVMPTVDTMSIKTEVLDPITISDTECSFQIPRNGILDGGSFVSLAVTTDGNDGFLPCKTGIYSLIKSAHLLIGSKEISSCSDCGHYETLIKQFSTPEHRAYVDSVKSGRSMDRFVEVDAANGLLMPLDMDYTTFATDASAEAFVPPNLKPTPSDATTPVFSVPLSDLIPMMKTRKLPLMAIEENVFLRLVFQTQSARDDGTILCYPNGSASSGVVVPSKVNIKFYSDHLYYSDDTMNQFMSQVYSDTGMQYLYEDQILTVAQVPSTANPAVDTVTEQRVERDVAVSGRTVRSLLVTEKFTALADNNGRNILGEYVSNDMETDTAYNWRINDQRKYDRDVTRPSHKYTELNQVVGAPLQVPSQLYSYDVDTDKSNAANKLNQNSVYIGKLEGYQLPNRTNSFVGNDIRCTSHYIGLDMTLSGSNFLGNGKKVGSKPIILSKTYKRTNGKNEAREMRIYASVERLMTLRNGTVLVSA